MIKRDLLSISEYCGRPLRRGIVPRKTYACDQCKRTGLSGIYGPVDGKDVWLCNRCFKPYLVRRGSPTPLEV